MQKFHRKPDGTPGKCNATTGRCPYEETPHFDSLPSCQDYCDTLNGTIEFYRQMAKEYYEDDWKLIDKEKMDKFLEKYAAENIAENPVRLQKKIFRRNKRCLRLRKIIRNSYEKDI